MTAVRDGCEQMIAEQHAAVREAQGSHEARLRAEDANNLKQLAIVCKMYSNENRRELWPPLDGRPGLLVPSKEALYPEYIADVSILISPWDERPPADDIDAHFAQSSYWYMPYFVFDDVYGRRAASTVREAIKAGEPLPDMADRGGGVMLRRLQEGAQAFFGIPRPEGEEPETQPSVRYIGEWTMRTGAELDQFTLLSQSQIPVFIGRPHEFESGVRGANVLFMDGHVEFIAYPGKFPMTQAFISALEEIDALREGAQPRAEAREQPAPAQRTPVTVDVLEDGGMMLNGEERSLLQLRRVIAERGGGDPEFQMLIHAAPDAPAGAVIAILEACAAAEVRASVSGLQQAEPEPSPASAGTPVTGLAPLLAGWVQRGSNVEGFAAGLAQSEPDLTLAITARSDSPSGFSTIMTERAAAELCGKQARLTARLKAEAVSGWAGLWMRVDRADGGVLSFDNMRDRPITGTADWHEYEVVLSVPEEAHLVAYGVLLNGGGRIEFTQPVIEPVG